VHTHIGLNKFSFFTARLKALVQPSLKNQPLFSWRRQQSEKYDIVNYDCSSDYAYDYDYSGDFVTFT